MSRSMHERLKFTSEKDRELFCDLATPSDVRELVGTIERLQERNERLSKHNKSLVEVRDAALAEVERLTNERDELSKRLERMHRPRCDGYSDDPAMGWPLLENPCQFCGARQETDTCRDMTDTADCDKIRAERDAALAEVERLTNERDAVREQKSMDARTEEALASLKARLLTAKYTKAETLGVPPHVLQEAADTIERLQKESDERKEHIRDLQGRLWSVKGSRDQARKDRDRKDQGWCEAVQKLSQVRADRNEAQGRIVELEQERDAALAEVERFQAVLKFLHAYEMGDAITFVDPNNGDLVSANYEARALASACLQGPAVG